MKQIYQNIMVPVDGSKESELAFDKALKLAKHNNASLSIVHVIDTRAFQNISSFDSEMVQQVANDAEVFLNEYEKIAKDAGIENVHTFIEYGSPKLVLAEEFPADHKIDLIIIGSTGLNAVELLLIGSVTEFVTQHAPTDVLVVRTDSNNQQVSKKG